MNILSNKTDEIRLWDDFREGSDDAFAKLFSDYSDRLYFYGLKFVDDQELVKDCIQDLFVKLHANRKNLSSSDNPLFYLFRSLKNRIIDEIQNKDKLVYFSQQDLPFIISYRSDTEENDSDDTDVREKFEAILNLLPDRQKEAIYLRYKVGMSYDEISQLLGINYQSARNLIHRAIEKIRLEMNLTIFIVLLMQYVE